MATDRDYFTADLHLGHANIMKHTARTAFMTREDRETFLTARDAGRSLANWKPGKASVDAMDEALISTFNDVVPADATLWIVGDVALTTSKGDARRYRDAIRCRDVRIIWGNHDKRHHLEPVFQASYEAVMVSIGADRTLTEDQIQASKDLRRLTSSKPWRRSTSRVFLNHYPQAVWHHAHRGVFHLYGHAHGGFERWREAHMPHALSMDIGVDCWDFAPVPWSRIVEVLGAKRDLCPPHDIDHDDRRSLNRDEPDIPRPSVPDDERRD